jgi:hypothetical protein
MSNSEQKMRDADAQQLLQHFNWELVENPVHRPDLLPSIFHLLLHLKKRLSSQKFQEDEKVKNVVTAWLRSKAADFCDFRIQKLIPRLNKCLDKGGDYIEK